jgi:hypothetical protein
MWYSQIDTPQENAEKLILSLTCVDALPCSGLSYVLITISNVLQVKVLGVRRFVV